MRIMLVAILATAALAVGQNSGQDLGERASREFKAKNFAAAEKDYRELAKSDPANLMAHAYLGHSLFRQEKFVESIGSYEKARELESVGRKLSESDHRILIDQLVMAYGVSGQLKKAHKLLDQAIQEDPNYPLNYYNRACAFAQDGDKSKALANLDLAFQRKANVLKGEQMPDPRVDSSFQRYVRDADFLALMRKLGFQ